MKTVGELMQMRDMSSQIALRQAQTQQFQQQAQDTQMQMQQRQRALADQNTLQQGMLDPAVSARVHTGDFSDFEGKVQPASLDLVRKSQVEYQKSLLANTQTQNTLRSEALGRIVDTAVGLKGLVGDDGKPDLGKINAALPGAVAHLQATQSFKDAQITAAPPTSITDPQQLDQWLAQIGGAKAATDQVLAQQGKQAETGAKTTEAALTAAKTPGAQAESEKAQLVTNAMKAFMANPQSGAQQIDAILPASLDPQANASYKATLQSVMQLSGPEAAGHVIEAAAAHASALTQALNPQTRAAKIADTVATEKATAPIKVSTAAATAAATAGIEVQKAIAVQKALRQGDNPAVAGVAPAAVGQVQQQAIKFDEEYIKAKASTEAMGHLLDLAQSGNKAAGSNLPLVGVETLNAINGIKRVNSAEISQYGSAGSLLDQLKGKLGKLVAGQPIPQDVLDDTRELHQVLGQQSYQNYTDSINTLNARTGSKFEPTIGAPNIRKGGGTIAIKTRDGAVHTFASQAEADKFNLLVRQQEQAAGIK